MQQAKIMLAVGVLLATTSTTLALDAGPLQLQSEEPAAEVTVHNFEFQDQESGASVTTIEAGETVRWTWQTGCHTVTEGVRDAENEPLTSPTFDTGEQCAQFDDDGNALTTFETTFEEPGVYKYFCKPHPQMEGLVVVTEAP